MTAPFTTSDRLFDYGGPQPYGASPVCTPFADLGHELEWQKTQHALGRPVDIAALFAMIERADEELEEGLKDAKADADESGRGQQVMADAIDVANEAVNAVRTVFAEEIIGKLNRIDRHIVARVLKEQMKRLDEIQKELVKSKP